MQGTGECVASEPVVQAEAFLDSAWCIPSAAYLVDAAPLRGFAFKPLQNDAPDLPELLGIKADLRNLCTRRKAHQAGWRQAGTDSRRRRRVQCERCTVRVLLQSGKRCQGMALGSSSMMRRSHRSSDDQWDPKRRRWLPPGRPARFSSCCERWPQWSATHSSAGPLRSPSGVGNDSG